MAFPVVEEVTLWNDTANGTDHWVQMPATVNAGDLLIVIIGNDGDSAMYTPSGWTQLYSEVGGTGVRGGAYAKDAVGDEDGDTVNFETQYAQKACAHTYRIRTGTWAGTVPDDVEATGTGSGGTTPDPPSETASWGAKDNLWIACYSADGDETISDWPDNYTSNQNWNETSAGGDCSTGSCSREYNSASDNPTTFTISAWEDWVAGTIVIEPAEATTFYQDVGGHAMGVAGTLSKKGFVNAGGHAMSISGSLSPVPTWVRLVGEHSVAIAGTLLKKGFVNVGSHPMSIAGTLNFGQFQVVGGYAMTITGDCTPIAVIGQIVGQGAVAITGTLATIWTAVKAVGSGAVAIAGTLLKKTSISVGSGAMAIAGTLVKKTSIAVGAGAVVMTGVLDTAITFMQAVGGTSMDIAGTLETNYIPSGNGGCPVASQGYPLVPGVRDDFDY